MLKPVVIDLCCGLGGWTRGFLAEGYDAIGFDIERHEYGEKKYPAELILKDITTICGYDLRSVNPVMIVASPPCQAYSYRAMPWKRAKALPPPDNTLFETCFHKPKGFNVTAAQRYRDQQDTGIKQGGDWFGKGEDMSISRRLSSRSDSRKAASAMIAEIPFDLAQHVARVFKPA